VLDGRTGEPPPCASRDGSSPILKLPRKVADAGLLWQEWDEIYIVYHPSAAETHVFNETTASILRSLEQGALSADSVKQKTEASLGIDPGELTADDFAFATMRLEELGLIERLDDASPAR
jgi:PqqD family protein of HPr-rel-A system